MMFYTQTLEERFKALEEALEALRERQNKKVYLVYDGYIESIEAIFASREKAQKYIDKYNGACDYKIDEWDLID